METPFIPANVRSVMLKASSILKPEGVKNRSYVGSEAIVRCLKQHYCHLTLLGLDEVYCES